MIDLPWYDPIKKALAPSAPLMIGLAVVLTVIGVWLIVRREWPALAAYLTYLVMP